MAITDEQKIRDLESQADVVVTLTNLLAMAKKGEFRAIVVAAEMAKDGHHATVFSNLDAPSQKTRLVGLLYLALQRLAS